MAGGIIIIGIAIFVAGLVFGAIAMISAGIKREEREFSRSHQVSITGRALGPASQAGRLATGLHVRKRTDARPAVPDWEDTLR
jgi:hypothetical protein